MSDFPEKIWVTHKEEFPGHVSFRASNLDHSNSPDGTYPEYIRADLVPQWRPIETIPDGETVIAIDPYGRARVVTKNNESKDFPVEDKSAEASYAVAAFTHWMPIPKVQE